MMLLLDVNLRWKKITIITNKHCKEINNLMIFEENGKRLNKSTHHTLDILFKHCFLIFILKNF